MPTRISRAQIWIILVLRDLKKPETDNMFLTSTGNIVELSHDIKRRRYSL